MPHRDPSDHPAGAEPEVPAPVSARAFPIVGIGCSAGGFEALTAFLSHVPPGSDMAFVIVQHFDPDRVSSLPELLQRVTPMQVFEARDGVAVAANCVYVIPPNKDLAILRGTVHLQAPVEARGLRLSVDFFLRSLAADRKERSIGVILSGMGSDGVLGLRAIKAASGLVLAQDPGTAKADSMPNAAIAAGVVDIVATADQLPNRIIEFLRHAPHLAPRLGPEPAKPKPGDGVDDSLHDITVLLRGRCGNDFSLYKPGTLQRRVERRIALHRLAGTPQYLQYLLTNPQELDLLFKEMLIGVTSFFRDPGVWETLRTTIIPAMLSRHPEGHAFRAWVPACSSGEEAYTLAMVFLEAVAAVQPGPQHTLQIYATDLDPEAIGKARKGIYPKNIALDVGADRITRFFVEDHDHYRVAKDVRNMLIFAQQNIVSDPPFTKLDVLSCRNLLIYFGPEQQRKMFPLFHYALNRGGALLLGNAETIGHFDHLFASADAKNRIYLRLGERVSLANMAFPAPPPADPLGLQMTSRAPVESLGQLTDQLIQQTYAPAGVLVSGDGDILYISGRTGKYLEPAAGRVNINIHAMARPGLSEALTDAIRRALNQAEPVLLRNIKVGTNGGRLQVDVTLQGQGAESPEALRGRVLIVFRDVATPPATRRTQKPRAAGAPDALTQELNESREALRVTREETQASLEELKSANEELQSTNEELQSTNEELTTSKEEMQSMNEEMRTVNNELQSKVHDLTWERNDMANLLNSTEIATIFLDDEMRLRRFTAFATRLFKLIPGDVGRPLSDLVSELDYPRLQEDALDVLRTLVFSEKEIRAKDGHWYRVRIMPYRTQDNVIDGVVSTFVDITETKLLESELRRLNAQN